MKTEVGWLSKKEYRSVFFKLINTNSLYGKISPHTLSLGVKAQENQSIHYFFYLPHKHTRWLWLPWSPWWCCLVPTHTQAQHTFFWRFILLSNSPWQQEYKLLQFAICLKIQGLKSKEHWGMKWMDTDNDKRVWISELHLTLKTMTLATSYPLAKQLRTWIMIITLNSVLKIWLYLTLLSLWVPRQSCPGSRSAECYSHPGHDITSNAFPRHQQRCRYHEFLAPVVSLYTCWQRQLLLIYQSAVHHQEVYMRKTKLFTHPSSICQEHHEEEHEAILTD